MKTKHFILGLCIVILAMVGNVSQAEAGTYTVGKYTFTATHCNSLGICHDPSQAEAANVFAYAIGAQKMTYVHTMACGNTVTLKIKSCKVSNVCSGGNSVNLSKTCKKTTTTCSCGCANGVCNTCPGDDDNPDNDPDLDPEDEPKDEEPPVVIDPPTTSECPDGVTIFPVNYEGSVPSYGTRSTKTYADCGVTPPADDTPPVCPFPDASGGCPPPDITLTAVPKLISKGGSCLMKWMVSGAESCTFDGQNVNPVSGSKSVSPIMTTAYKMSCKNGPTEAVEVELCSVQDVIER